MKSQPYLSVKSDIATQMDIVEGENLDKDKAIQVVKQMSSTCGIDLAKSSLMIMPQNAEGINSAGPQLHVKAELDFGSRTCLYAIVDEYKLKLKETPDKIVILDPAKPEP